MEDAPHPEIIIVRRHGGHDAEHHGGAWKIAFADFMTAMMAFFLVLWIINATDKDTRAVIARYFNPVKLEESSRTPKSIHGDGSATPAADTPEESQTPKPKQSGPAGSAKTADGKSPSTAAGGVAKQEPNPPGAAVNLGDPASPKANMSEGVLFADPYRALDAIAGPTSPDVMATAQPEADTGVAPPTDGLADPFRVAARQAADAADRAAARPPAEAPTQQATPPQNAPPPPSPSPAASPSPSPQPIVASPAPSPSPVETVVAAKPTPAPSESSTPAAAESKPTAATAAKLQKQLDLQIAQPGTERLGPAVDVKATDEGLLISLTDKLNFSMFAIGSAEPQPQLIHAMDAIAAILKQQPGLIVVRGHTDAHPYKSATYDNWRLSSARAQMAYYMLTRAGLSENRFEKIEGYADKKLRNSAQPFAAENRRIEILLKGAKP